ncbi:AraC family transcriptional regulator [Gluconobacter thailandicus]|uniref:GlxA family transcriptional regulator n=1 Tax=Gluconobacter thailandicus TaxID=257438 RepID=UPI0007772982|nr:GlxA family transcriptional regulator [Gluconobacter thailandicus]KXV35773.1 AraC family transcriptional regulator [Gluconobacter thailandicus]
MSRQPPLDIVLVAYPTAQKAALYGLTDLFAVADELSRKRLERTAPVLRVLSMDPDRFSGGSFGRAEGSTSLPDAPSVVIIPPSLTGPPNPETVPELLTWLRTCHEGGSILAAVCAGTFLLAATGLLDGRPATTHWITAARLQQAFPAIRIDPDRLLLDDGDILTVGGIMSWPDLGLRLIDRLLGPAAMLETARYLLIDPPRHDQRQYRHFAPNLTHGDRTVLKVQHWLRTETARDATVADMTRLSGLEERTFLRRFHKATSLTPLAYLQHLRVEKGRDLLEATTLPLDQIAWEVGYQDSGAFRKIFTRLLGQTPADYRRRVSPAGDSR